MTEKELKKLNRVELLELLLKQSQCIEELEAKLEEAESKLKDRSLAISDAGSIAEAAIQVNGVFEAAEAAAKQYLDNIKACSEQSDRMISETQRRCAEMEKRAFEKVMKLKVQIDEVHSMWKDLGAADSVLKDSV